MELSQNLTGEVKEYYEKVNLGRIIIRFEIFIEVTMKNAIF
jgi:hypothetical protein